MDWLIKFIDFINVHDYTENSIQLHKMMQTIERRRIHTSICYNNNIKTINDISEIDEPVSLHRCHSQLVRPLFYWSRLVFRAAETNKCNMSLFVTATGNWHLIALSNVWLIIVHKNPAVVIIFWYFFIYYLQVFQVFWVACSGSLSSSKWWQFV